MIISFQFQCVNFLDYRALTEKIVKILATMKCPYTIEPHQIQGLDFINIYPLILWLIKYSSEFREAKEDELRKFAVMQYDKNHIFEFDRAEYVQKEKLLKNLAVVQVFFIFILYQYHENYRVFRYI